MPFFASTGVKWLATRTGYVSLASEAFIGGLLHDIGKLAIIKVLDEILPASSTQAQAAFSEILISDILIIMHEDIGHCFSLGFKILQRPNLRKGWQAAS